MATGFYESPERVKSIQHFLSNKKFHGTAKHFCVKASHIGTGERYDHHFLVKTTIEDLTSGKRRVKVRMLHYTNENDEECKVFYHKFQFTFDGTNAEFGPGDGEHYFEQLKAGEWILLTSRHYPDSKKDLVAAWQRARSKEGESKFHLLSNNCEHFVTWALTAEPPGIQAEKFLVTMGVAMLLVAGALSFFRT